MLEVRVRTCENVPTFNGRATSSYAVSRLWTRQGGSIRCWSHKVKNRNLVKRTLGAWRVKVGKVLEELGGARWKRNASIDYLMTY